MSALDVILEPGVIQISHELIVKIPYIHSDRGLLYINEKYQFETTGSIQGCNANPVDNAGI